MMTSSTNPENGIYNSTSPTGVVTYYSYSASAPQRVATTNGLFVRTYLDGLGRVVKVESGQGGTVESVTETQYKACACSAAGKVWKVSRPRTAGGASHWTEYVYDALGRTIQVIQPAGHGTATTSYANNVTTSTDPAGKWKKYTVSVW